MCALLHCTTLEKQSAWFKTRVQFMVSENKLDLQRLQSALSELGKNEETRFAIIDTLRRAELRVSDRAHFRENVRWPILLALLEQNPHLVSLADGVKFQITPVSRIEKAFLLSSVECPQCFWEPQTTKLLVQLASRSKNAIIGGAYIGDHAIPMSLATKGTIHAFEPMPLAFEQLSANIALNSLTNVVANQLCLWDESDELLYVDGEEALASTKTARKDTQSFAVPSITIDDYAARKKLSSVELIMLDTEGSEASALNGAISFLSADREQAPDIIFEVHRNFVDWSNGLAKTEPVKMLLNLGYELYAIRDIQGSLEMNDYPIEIIPIDSVHLEGPPHGFNLLATKRRELLDALALKVVKNVSPKLIQEKDPMLHHPLKGWPKEDTGAIR